MTTRPTHKQVTAEICRQQAQNVADRYPKTHPLWGYYQSWADSFAELATGQYNDPGTPFSCSREIKELPGGRAFVEAWSKEISVVGTFIITTANDMISKLKEKP